MAEIKSPAEAYTALDTLQGVVPSDHQAHALIPALRAYHRSLEQDDHGREALRTLFARVDTRMELTEPIVTRGTDLLAREVKLLDAATARALGDAANGSRLLNLATSRPALALYGLLAALLSGWLGIQTGASPSSPGAASAAQESP